MEGPNPLLLLGYDDPTRLQEGHPEMVHLKIAYISLMVRPTSFFLTLSNRNS